MATAEAHRRDVAKYYRWLDKLEWMRVMRGETGNGAQPVHRALRDPDGGETSPGVVHRLMAGAIPLPANPRVLDAGCGYGATMLDLAPKLGGEWLGITLSDVQVKRGNEEAAARGLPDVRLEVGSFDAPPPGPFDWIYGIESLIHSPDPGSTIAALAARLAPGGWLTIVDDMPEDALPPEAATRVDTFRRCWRAPVAPGRAAWLAHAAAAGLEPGPEIDLTPLTLSRPMAELAPRIAARAREARWKRLLGLGYRSEADLGGMTLETLLADGSMRYRMLTARRPA
ncbi:methyltransferase domain-containing protein [Rhodovarius crocodyli]|uniref:Methyltransferase domain-containing protein n=1 Tax=Rhodovarius crocodyli TaxID=1979269 RepID=A0A437MH00_9PROT|nr:methyltransferase domain-containing protein [Rhodovarius crocodyli]RVT96911.1 methyltransferase domain-containing protein [Rhodovarius crocodyli]